MKRIFIALLMCISMLDVMAFNDSERPVAFASLPQQARNFITAHFPDVEVVRSLADKDLISLEYEVTLANGFSVEFDRKGRWKEVDGNGQTVPDAIIPPAVLETVRREFPRNVIIEISLDNGLYEVTLDNGLEFDIEGSGKMVRIDD